MTIKEVSERFGVSTDTLRYYERIGLIPQIARTAGGIRDYTESDIISKVNIPYTRYKFYLCCNNFNNFSAAAVNGTLSSETIQNCLAGIFLLNVI